MGIELAKTTVADVLTYGAKGDISWSVGNNSYGQEVIWNTPWGALKSDAPFFCEFSIANLAAVIGVLLTAGFSIEQLALVMPEISQVPGRLETLNPDSDKGPKVIVDFAHTPSAVEAVLQSVSGMTQGKIISVLGCGGNRDQGKRSQMGEIVTRLSDLVWLTSDNPRSEAPEEIINQMTSEVEATNFFVSIDRENAIRGAIHGAKKEDIVVLFGKGDETTQEINGVFLPFKDKDVAEKILRGLG
jgi:UDP-N-acetylmuramoyl-L-alanyl-D-glutamate--2,6-diaminopimelate ligase